MSTAVCAFGRTLCPALVQKQIIRSKSIYLPFFFTLSSFRKLIRSTALDVESYIAAEPIRIRLKTRGNHKQQEREDLFFLKKSEGKKSLTKKIIMLLSGYENHDVTTCINIFCVCVCAKRNRWG